MHSRVIEESLHRSLAAALALTLVLVACTEDDPDVGFESLPDDPGTASEEPAASASMASAEDIDVTTTPEEITPEWVTAVVNTILAEYGEMTAEILAMPVTDDPTLPEGFEDRLDDLFDGEYLERRRVALQNTLTNADDLRSDLLPADDFGGLRFETEEVPYAQDECIIGVGHISRELTIPQGGPLEELSAVSLALDAEGQWVIIDELANIGADGPNADSVMLEATLEDYEGNLDNSCVHEASS